MAPRRTQSKRPNGERLFFSGMALAMLAIVFVGFAPSYYLRGYVAMPARPLSLTPLIHIHAIIFSAWALLFVVQTLLVAGRRPDLHRRLGLAGFVLLPAMVFLGVLTALHAAARGAGAPAVPPLQFLAVPLFDVPVFAILIGAALWKRRNAPTHKRLMFLTLVSMVGPALARLPFPAAIPIPLVILGLPNLFLLALIAWDVSSQRRLHPATVWGGALLIGSVGLRVAVMATPAWLAFASWAVARVS